MKIRNGFVSNSSSSSFILSFPKFPKDVRELREMLLDNPDELFYEDWDDEVIPMEVIMKRIFNDIKQFDNCKDIHIEYSDNDGKIDTIIEHGGILDKVTVWSESHH